MNLQFVGRVRGRLGRGRAVALIGVAAVLVLGGCANSAGGKESHTDPALVADAKRIVKQAEAGLVWADGGGLLAPADIQEFTEWKGPEKSPQVEPGKNVQIIACLAGTICEAAAETMKSAMEAMDWNVEITASADGAPASYVSLMQTAITKEPDAIVMIGIPELGVAQQVEECKDAGIITLGLGVTEAGNSTYDVYVGNRSDLQMQLIGYGIIADSDGAAETILINTPGYPNLTEPTANLEKLLDSCAGCKTTVVNVSYADATNPVQALARTTAILQANPDVGYFVWPFDSFGLGPSIQAARAAGRSDVKFAGKDGNPTGVTLAASGDAWMVSAAPLNWGAYFAVDQLRRGFTGGPYLAADGSGVPAHIFTEANSPKGTATYESVDEVYAELFDYASEYEKLWGVKF